MDVESALYVLESRYSVGITGITGKTCQARESDCPEDHEDGDDDDEFGEGEAFKITCHSCEGRNLPCIF